jgi:tetratricopeptide (TPR) repeat protein
VGRTASSAGSPPGRPAAHGGIANLHDYRLRILYQDEGRYSEAEPLLTKALPLSRRVLGPSNTNTRGCLVSLAKIRPVQHRYAESESLLRESLSTRENEGPYAWQPFERRSLLGLSLMEQSKFAEAEPLLTSGYRGLVERKPALPVTVSLREAGERIMRLYNLWGRLDQVAEWRKEREAVETDVADAMSPTRN